MKDINQLVIIFYIFGASLGHLCGNLAMGLAVVSGIILIANLNWGKR
jgi:hypothetical protein